MARQPDVVLFACVHNAGRSQMAAASFNAIVDPHKANAVSAGTQPASLVHPVVVDAMREIGIDLTDARPQLLTQELAERAQMLVTMGCGDACPYVPGLAQVDWELRDPKNEPLDVVRRIRDDIRQRVAELVAAHGWQCDSLPNVSFARAAST